MGSLATPEKLLLRWQRTIDLMSPGPVIALALSTLHTGTHQRCFPVQIGSAVLFCQMCSAQTGTKYLVFIFTNKKLALVNCATVNLKYPKIAIINWNQFFIDSVNIDLNYTDF